jgi:hypothetical protein
MSDINMNDFTKPKSDQLNYDDLIGGDITIKIRDVKKHSAQQPVAIYFEGDNGKPWLPCKGMMRVLVAIWGSRAADYVGRSLTLWGDPTVTWAGAEVGGIRIRAMEGLKDVRVMPLSASKTSRKPFTVKPLVVKQAAPPAAPSNQVPPKPALSHQEQIDNLLVAFDKLGVTNDMLEAQQQCASVSFDIAQLREIYAKITKENMPISQFFNQITEEEI